MQAKPKRSATARPRVTVHYAQSLDGRIATRSGDSQWIGGPASLRFAHELRASHAAVLVGVGTVLADDPRLTTRLVDGPSPLRVVLDSTLRLPLGANVLTDGAAPTLVMTGPHAAPERARAVRERGGEVVHLPLDADGRVDLGAALACLAERGHASALIEGGGALITSALAGRLVDRLVVCIAPLVIGTGIAAVGDLGLERLREALQLRETTYTRLEQDLIVDGRLG
jgi:riboflavin-specific deaminase-like protein